MANASEASQQANRSGIDPRRLVIMFYLIAGVVLILFLDHLLSLIWARFGWPDPELVEGINSSRVTTLVAVALGLGTGLFCWFNPEIHRLSMEVAAELMKVTWPSWAETRVSTIAVVMTSLLASVILFGIDTIAYKVMVEWLPRLWGKM